jgi:transketolase
MDKILELKKIILELAYKIKEGHIASSFSIIDILYLLYNKIMSNDDMFILSKGHASLALYAILYDKGIISKEDLFSFCEFNSNLGGHPKLNTVMGINASTGSLGHGFPMAIGMALGRKINNKSGTIYCLIGDGEANEGTVYESMLIANQHNLDNICFKYFFILLVPGLVYFPLKNWFDKPGLLSHPTTHWPFTFLNIKRHDILRHKNRSH